MIHQNPFHRLGLVADIDVKAFTKRTGKVRAFLAADMPLSFDDDISFPGCQRNSTTMEVAERDLQTAAGKVKHGLFWFTSSGIVDEVALDHVRKGEFENALQIWSKAAKRSEFTKNYVSCLNNFASLNLVLALLDPNDIYSKPKRKSLLLEGVAGKFLLFTQVQSEVKKWFFQSIGDEVIAGQEKKIQDEFVDSLRNLLESSKSVGVTVTASDLAKHVDQTSDLGKSLIHPFLNEARDSIDLLLSEAKGKIEQGGKKALAAGKKLLKQAPPLLKTYKAVAGDDDILLAPLSDKVAEEILNAGIKYFNELDDPTASEIETVLELTKGAKKIAIGTTVVERLKGNLETLENRAKREREHEFIGAEIKKVNAAIEKAIGSKNRTNFSQSVLNELGRGSGVGWGVIRALRSLQTKGVAISGKDFLISDLYVEFCTLSMNVMLSKCIDEVNEIQNLGLPIDSVLSSFKTAEAATASLKEVSTKMDGRRHESKFPIEAKTRNRILENHETIKGLVSQANSISIKQSDSGGTVIYWVIAGVIAFALLTC